MPPMQIIITIRTPYQIGTHTLFKTSFFDPNISLDK
jgi:hypothetical protein